MNEVEDWSKMQSEFSDCLSLRIGNIYNTSTLFFLSQACQLAWQFISCCNYTKLIKKKNDGHEVGMKPSMMSRKSLGKYFPAQKNQRGWPVGETLLSPFPPEDEAEDLRSQAWWENHHFDGAKTCCKWDDNYQPQLVSFPDLWSINSVKR